MNSSSIFKKVFPVLLSVVLIIAIALIVSASTSGSKVYPSLDNPEGTYVEVKDKISGKDYTFKLTRQEMYEELKNGIGLSTIVTKTNIAILSKAEYKDGKSFFDSVSAEDIEKEISEATYGADVDPKDLDEEEKKDLEEKFKKSMLTGYGYKTDDDIKTHYQLVLAKELYAESKLQEAVKDEDNDLYIDEDAIDEYYEANYSKAYFALVVPFKDSDQASLTLQQLGVGVKDSKWHHITLEEINAGSGAYEVKYGEMLTPQEIVKTMIKLYDVVYGYKGEEFVKGTATLNADKTAYEFAKDDKSDYAVIDCSSLLAEIKPLLDEIKPLVTPATGTALEESAKTAALEKIASVQAKLDEIKAMLVYDAPVAAVQTIVDGLKKSLGNETSDETSDDPTILIDKLIKAVDEFDAEAYIFNTDNKDSKFYYDAEELKAYDSKLPSQFKNNYVAFVPYKVGDTQASENTSVSSKKWYAASTVSGTNVSYYLLKIKEEAAPQLADVKDEIIEKLTEEKLTSAYVEEKMAELRAEYKFQIFDPKLEKEYKAVIEDYEDVKYSSSKKKGTNVVASYEGGEITTADLFEYMDETSGIATLISELCYQRLMNTLEFNKYYNSETGEWLGEEGKEVHENIIANIENERLYYLSGYYSSYGYDPSVTPWEEFISTIYGASDPQELILINLYSQISSDYLEIISDAFLTETEGKDVSFLADYKTALESDLWKLVETKMQEALEKEFSVNGIHLLVSVYETVNDANASTDSSDSSSAPKQVAPEKWTAEQVQGAKDLIKEVKAYLDSAEGTYATKLQAVADAFTAAPYAVKDADGNYVHAIDGTGKEVEYVLESAGATVNVSKYKSLGLTVVYQSLGAFTNGQMVEPFEKAARAIWEQDMADEEYNRITVYPEGISEEYMTENELTEDIVTEFGYHLYVNLSSTKATTYKGVVVDENGNVVKETVDGEEVNKTEDRILPSLFEIRANIMLTALKAVDQTELTDEEKEELQALIDEYTAYVTTQVTDALKKYYDTLAGQVMGTSFGSLLQQKEIISLLEKGTISTPSNATLEEVKEIYEVNVDSLYEGTLTLLAKGDEQKFNIQPKAEKESE